MTTELMARFAPSALKAYFTEFGVVVWKWKWAFITFLSAMVLFQYFLMIGISTDKSIPGDHLYLVKKWDRTPRSGSRIAVHPKGGAIGPPAELIMVKFVRGIPGDQITVIGRDVWVGREQIGRAKEFTRQGQRLTVTQSGVIPDGMIFVAGIHKDSFDSRYQEMGLVPESAVVGNVITIF